MGLIRWVSPDIQCVACIDRSNDRHVGRARKRASLESVSRDRGSGLRPLSEGAPRNEGVRHDAASSRRLTPELRFILVPSKHEGAGKAGCRPHPWPASNKKSWRQSPQVWPNNRPSLRNGFTAYRALSLGTGLSCPHRRADVISAAYRQRRGDRTTRFRRPRQDQSSAQRLRADLPRPSHPALNVRDDREAPLLSERGTARIMRVIWGRSQAYF
jgi:hypothetical protein